jgi:translation initiation factor IF-2
MLALRMKTYLFVGFIYGVVGRKGQGPVVKIMIYRGTAQDDDDDEDDGYFYR